MAKITERENFYRMIEGKDPAFIPHQPSLMQMIIPSVIRDRAPGLGSGTDWFGVSWTEDPGMPMMPMTTPGIPPVLSDIENWEEVIDWPDLSEIDWEAAARSDVREKDPTRVLTAMLLSGPFERLHDLMGFEDALCALMLDPDSVGTFFAKLCDFKIEQIHYLKRYYDIDMVHFQDDWGSQTDLFFNPDIWRKLIKPNIKRVVDAAHEEGIIFDMHSCGKIDRIIDEIVELGVDVINPCQPVNDLTRWSHDFSRKVIFEGGLNAQEIIDRPDVTDEEIYREVKDKIDLFATDGYYIPFAVSLTSGVSKALDYSYIYGRTFYSDEYADDVEAFKQKMLREREDSTAAPSWLPSI